ncbi:hypothetical protein [Blattabacterium cuenoti]|uniref:hypothetical protein n=1 Tax=Blattabacterium cuenoti TaxID=1653831 RepID=UPI001EEB7456|nr:hypothetical protein [Blattabacterium cuenoti]
MFSIILGIIVSVSEILFSIKLIKKKFVEIQFISLKNLKDIFIHAPTKFFIILIFFYALSAFLGGITTSFFVQKAKKAYAMLNGFILLIIFFIQIFLYTIPIWFKIIILTIFFPISYLGGEFIENVISFIPKKWTLLINKKIQKNNLSKRSN